MAEIKIEKKRPVWPWIILILIILGAIVYYFLYSPDTNLIKDYPNTETIESTGSGNS